MSKLKEAALAYAKRGFPIFPTRSDKKPYTKTGVLDATTNLKKIEDWWEKWPNANIGFHVGAANMLAVDLDPDHDINILHKNIGKELPRTKLFVRTPRDGLHLYYALEPSETVPPVVGTKDNGIGGAHVDIRSFHSYTLLPPSKTNDGVYLWEGEGKPHFRPDGLIEAIGQGREQSEDHDNWIIEPDLEDNIDLCVKWLADEAKIGIKGEGGDHTTYSTAAMCKSFGISPEMALDLMWEHWCPRCSPPWDSTQLDHLELKIKNGYTYNTSPPGNMTPAYRVAKHQEMFKAVSRETTTDGGNVLKIGRFTFTDRMAMKQIKPPEWLIEDCLPKGSYSLLVGPRGTYKTFIALDMALSVATGAPFEDWLGPWPKINGVGPVLFAAGEGKPGLNSRVEAWERYHMEQENTLNFSLVDPVPSPNPEDVDAFIEGALSRNSKYSLVVLDTVGRSMQGMNENSQQDASQFTQMIEIIQRELNTAVLAIHHTGHNEDNRSRGSSVFGADVDAEFILSAEEHLVTLDNTKQKDAELWKKPNIIKINKCAIHDTLVAVKADKRQAEKAQTAAINKDKKGKGKRTQAEMKASLGVIKKAAYKFLKNIPNKQVSTSALAKAIAADENVFIGSQTIGKTYLPDALIDKDHPLYECYDSAKALWCYAKE